MKYTSIALVVIAAMFFTGCSCHRSLVYQFGESYIYDVFFVDVTGDTTQSCSITMTPKKLSMFGDYGLRYDYEPCMGQPAYYENTSFIENSDGIELHPPRMGTMAFTEVVPYPNYHYPLGVIVSGTGEIDIRKSTFRQAEGKTISYEYKQDGTDTILFNGKPMECYLVTGKNTSHIEMLGRYCVTYWFHPTYGFIRWKYILPDRSTCLLYTSPSPRDA